MPKKKATKWIAGVIKKPGALRASVKRMFGAKGFTEGGAIKAGVLSELAKRSGKIGRRARLAKTLKKF